MDWFFGNDPTSGDEASTRLMTAQATTALTFIIGLVSLFVYLNFVTGVAANAVLILTVACLVASPMAYAHALELRRHVVAMHGKMPMTTDDFDA